MRTTKEELETKIRMIQNVASRLGVIGLLDETHMDMGSKINGRAFRLFLTKQGKRGTHHTHPCAPRNIGYLGMTKSEANDSLGFILDTLFAFDNKDN